MKFKNKQTRASGFRLFLISTVNLETSYVSVLGEVGASKVKQALAEELSGLEHRAVVLMLQVRVPVRAHTRISQ